MGTVEVAHPSLTQLLWGAWQIWDSNSAQSSELRSVAPLQPPPQVLAEPVLREGWPQKGEAV